MSFLSQIYESLVGRKQPARPPPLKEIQLPRILPEHQSNLLYHGWSQVPLNLNDPSDELYTSFQDLFAASKAFFDLPKSYKEKFLTKLGSEDGWSHVEGEKEFITLRTVGNTPEELQEAASKAWSSAGTLLDVMLGRLAEGLGMPAEALTVYSSPNVQLDGEQRSTMMRLFRYEGDQAKIVAERKSICPPNYLSNFSFL